MSDPTTKGSSPLLTKTKERSRPPAAANKPGKNGVTLYIFMAVTLKSTDSMRMSIPRIAV
jgi:hypothetical protein